MSLEAWGDEGAGETDGYVTDERAQEMVDEAIAPLLEAVRAMYAWFYCEDHLKSSHASRQELCNYTQHLCNKALGETTADYVGLPMLYLHGIERADEDNCKGLIKEVFDIAQSTRDSEGSHG